MKSARSRRIPSAGVIELHVFCVPAELWNSKLNTVSNHVINKFISVGFIRVLPDLNLKALRQQVGELLGARTVDDKFAFLKCVGRSLAVVSTKQESELKVKTFAPPYAPQPELYLLPGVGRRQLRDLLSVDNQELLEEVLTQCSQGTHTAPYENKPPGELKCSICSYQACISLSPDRDFTYISHQTAQSANRVDNTTPREHKADDFTHKGQHIQSPERTSTYSLPHQRSKSTKTGEITDSRDSKANGFLQEVHNTKCLDMNSAWEQETHCNSPQNTGESNQKMYKSQQQEQQMQQRDKDVPASSVIQMDISSVAKQSRIQSNSTGDSGLSESLDEKELEYCENLRKKSEQANQGPESINDGQRTNQTIGYSTVTKNYSLPPPPPPLDLNLRAQSEFVPTEKEQLIAQINATKQERKCLERAREELVKKAKGLLAQNRLRRNQVRNSWKKKYFESKKLTAPLEETSCRLRKELEQHYLKLLQHLEARDSRKRPTKSTSTSDPKNDLIIQITTLKHEIDQLCRSVENAKMKLITEIKLRKQTSTDLRALRAELAQKKTQSSLNRLHGGSVTHSLNVLVT
ncbi:spermatogenesis-associated protein 1 [Stegostoma tigrinum]|uniref:spermatogenesis-associated protein 1 n=1 Tax=Stegostoma tigrinum TaxID=3053191 RepID=UPI00202BA2B6|nr:spermatogenesis-associated protein 1 [Stegostoma tigrinum]